MSNSYFQFKQFRVDQDKCAMKVCTDSCIFGASIGDDSAGKILDIGAGTGLISLMLAQRFKASIDAVEINQLAADQARSNFSSSPWSSRLKLYHDSIQNFAALNDKKYDQIVCNPPFFSNHLKSPDVQKNTALHNSSLPFADLVSAVNQLLTSDGKFFILLPLYESQIFESIASARFLYPFARINIYNQTNKPIFRVITSFSREENALIKEENFNIRDQEGSYSKQFVSLLGNFYLNL